MTEPQRADHQPAIEDVEVAAYTFPTDAPESDGTLTWDSTTMVLVRLQAGGRTGIGYTYAGAAAAEVVSGSLADVVRGRDATTPAATWAAMHHAVRNLGRPGLVADAVSAVDLAAWDLHARLLGVPLCTAVGAVHEAVPVYGSGGFTSYDVDRLCAQLAGWADAGIDQVKMKVGRDPRADTRRVRAARDALGVGPALFVDANGAYSRKQALAMAESFATCGVGWFEEPVSSDDLEGLRLVRDRAPAGMDVAAGEYGYDLPYFHRMLDAQAVDCLQADVTRCGGITALVRVAALCDARGLDLSLHCAPQASAHVATALWHLRHLEYFHDHVRIERLAFDGVLEPQPGGVLIPDRDRPGHGLTVRDADIEEHRVR
ncbi:enolase C-terminal domain-like protein [Pseudonocardia sp. MH-G8]|uniref:enolase C-terminal domain-like protein n=1 Tax=Pseudonocardia sp. MH-G8 TaxID=1854588 RepID=UPI000BA15CAD|nr:enolase C-terminal domain-like protein [Pseudonocardia sp. MH-G8]OZM77233.1 mandelate racemase [Pseudonocardia sp. MH-G8]